MKSVVVLLLAPVLFAYAQQPAAESSGPAAASPAASAVVHAPLTPAEVQAAIARGLADKQQPGLRVQSIDTDDFAGTGCRHCGEVMFTVNVFTTAQWIEAQAFAAKQAKKPFPEAAISEPMRQAAVYVMAQEVRNDLDLKAGVAGDIGFRGIQLADPAEATKIEPLQKKFTQQTGAPGSGLTGYVSTAAATSVFSVDAVKSLVEKSNGDFSVILTLPTRQKVLKVKGSALKQAL